jgi:hypothetical protein
MRASKISKNDRGGTRTHDQRINLPSASARAHRCKSKPDNEESPESSHKRILFDPHLIHDTCKTDPDLAAVVVAWPNLPEAIRAGIVAMVRAASGEDGDQYS